MAHQSDPKGEKTRSGKWPFFLIPLSLFSSTPPEIGPPVHLPQGKKCGPLARAWRGPPEHSLQAVPWGGRGWGTQKHPSVWLGCYTSPQVQQSGGFCQALHNTFHGRDNGILIAVGHFGLAACGHSHSQAPAACIIIGLAQARQLVYTNKRHVELAC